MPLEDSIKELEARREELSWQEKARQAFAEERVTRRLYRVYENGLPGSYPTRESLEAAIKDVNDAVSHALQTDGRATLAVWRTEPFHTQAELDRGLEWKEWRRVSVKVSR